MKAPKSQYWHAVLKRVGVIFKQFLIIQKEIPREHTIRKHHSKLEKTTVPYRLLLSRNTTFPDLHVDNTIGSADWLSKETKRVFFTPLLSAISVSQLCIERSTQ